MESKDNGNSARAIQVVMELREDIFRRVLSEGGVAAWNRYVLALFDRSLLGACWPPAEVPPLVVLLDLRGLRVAHYALDGIDLRLAWLQNAQFDKASLRNSRLGCARNASYKGARLHGADFRHIEISGCDFADAVGLDTALFDGAMFDPANPPTGLPSKILGRCRPEADPPPADPRAPTNPMEPSGYEQSPIRCLTTIHFIPIEN